MHMKRLILLIALIIVALVVALTVGVVMLAPRLLNSQMTNPPAADQVVAGKVDSQAALAPGGDWMQRGSFLGFTSPAKTANPETFAIASGAKLTGQISFGNGRGKELGYLMVCLIDYVQTPCGKGQTSPTDRFTLANGAIHKVDVEMTGLRDGLHDYIVVVFFVPDLHDTDDEYRSDSRFLFLFNRMNIIVGASMTPPSVQFQPIGEPNEGAKQGEGVIALTSKTDQGPDSDPLRVVRLSKGQSQPFHVWWNNPMDQPSRLALITFIDFKQTPLLGGKPVLFGEMAAHSQAILTGAVPAPTEPGPHELVTLIIENPFVSMAGQANSATPISLMVNSTERALVQLR